VIASANVVFRVPDLYNFEIARSDILKELGLNVEADEVGDALSDFLLHRSDEIALNETVQEKTAPVFSFVESVRIQQLRDILDKSLIVFGVAMVSALLFFILVMIFGKRRFLKVAFRASIAFFCALIGVSAVLAVSDDVWKISMDAVGILSADPNGTLERMFSATYRIEAVIALSAGALIMYVILFSVARIFYKEQTKMFT